MECFVFTIWSLSMFDRGYPSTPLSSLEMELEVAHRGAEFQRHPIGWTVM